NVGTSESHHFEIEAPALTEIIRADIVARESGKKPVRRTDQSNKRYAHVRLDRQDAGVAALATAAVRLRASRGGLLTAGAILAPLLAGLFWFTASRLVHIEKTLAGEVLIAI